MLQTEVYCLYLYSYCSTCILIVPLPWLSFFCVFSSVARQIPGYNSPSRGTGLTLPKFFVVLKIFVLFYVLFVLCRSVYCFCVNVYCSTAPGGNPIAVNKYRVRGMYKALNNRYQFCNMNAIIMKIMCIYTSPKPRSPQIGMWMDGHFSVRP
jgi:hypothetical protein